MRLVLALVVSLLLAGCVSTKHSAHGGGALEVIAGVENVGADPVAAQLKVVGPGLTTGESIEVGAGETKEKRFVLQREGRYTVSAKVTWTRGTEVATVDDDRSFDTENCRSYHVVFVVDATDGIASQQARVECH